MEQQKSNSEEEYLAECIKKTFVGLIVLYLPTVHRFPKFIPLLDKPTISQPSSIPTIPI